MRARKTDIHQSATSLYPATYRGTTGDPGANTSGSEGSKLRYLVGSIYFFELREQYVCSWCGLHDNDLILVLSRESGRQARHVRYPNDATIVGRVTALSLRIAEAA